MAKKDSTFGKFLAFTTAVAAIGGTCYIFRDQIKESKIYKKASGKFSDIFGKVSDTFADDDFIFDEDFEDDFSDDVFSEEAKSNREYTSITINPKESTTSADSTDIDSSTKTVEPADETKSTEATDETENATSAESTNNTNSTTSNESSEELKEIFANNSFSNISTGTIDISPSDTTDNASDTTERVTGYENEGLSDVSEDPEILADTDKLDF